MPNENTQHLYIIMNDEYSLEKVNLTSRRIEAQVTSATAKVDQISSMTVIKPF